MTTFVQNFRTVFLTLLFGFIASLVSTSVLADAATDYANLSCGGCHGTPPGTGAVKFTTAQLNAAFPTNVDLANFITANMPVGNVGACNAACGQEMAHFIRPLPPLADMSQSTITSGVAPLLAKFDATKSICDNGCISYAWNFGDSSTGNGKVINHNYVAAGNYTATLTVTDAQGLQSSTSITVPVTAAVQPPVARGTVSPLNGVAPLNVSFDASPSTCNGGCSLYLWSSTDNVVFASGVKTNETIQSVGTHVVTLLVIDAQGLRNTSAPVTITVTASSNPPVANASSSSNLKGAAPLTVQFGDLSTCDNTCGLATWNFGDGTTGTSSPGSGTGHVYTNPGTYTATLTATDASNGKKASTTVQVVVVPAESLTAYVSACQTQLGFQNINIPSMNCFDGDLFDTRAPKNDYLVYKKITDQVDLAVACRWVSGVKPNGSAVSIEMLINNRQSGNSCFFSAIVQGPGISVPTNIVPPTDPAASSYWHQPKDVDATVRCIGCHIEGPYIATPLIAPFLAKDGLMNNGHDTGSNITAADLTQSFNTSHVKYHAISGSVNGVPGAFSLWDSLKQTYIDPAQSTCSMGCHVIGTLSPQGNIDIPPAGNVLFDPFNELFEINEAGAMPPYNDDSDYRWMNLGNPITGASGVDAESFAAAITATNTLVPHLFNDNPNCAHPSVPVGMSAHTVGIDASLSIDTGTLGMIDGKIKVLGNNNILRSFNLKDGVVCLNADQDAGVTCQDYTVSYLCSNGGWTQFFNQHVDTNGSDDHEERANINNQVLSACGGSAPVGIKANTLVSFRGGTTVATVIGPNDRLARFSLYGLTCNNADQPNGQCSNYVVKYNNCTAPPPTVNRAFTNENTTAGSKQLTAASGSLVKGQGHNPSWNTQQWAIEPVTNTEYVRLRNTGTNVYLNVTSTAEQATVGTAAFNSTATGEMWIIEPISNSSEFRLRNLFSGKYLTMADPNNFPNSPDFLPIFSQGRNPGWNTQRWIIQ